MSEIRAFLRFFSYIFVPVIVGFGTYLFLDYALFRAADPDDTKARLIEISSDDFRSIAKQLQAEGIVRYSKSLELLAKMKGVEQSIKLGEYALAGAMTPGKVLEKLLSGKRHERKLILSAGDSIWDVGEQVGKAGIIEAADFTDAAVRPALLVRAGISSSSFEGYLGVGEYSFSKPVKPEQIVWAMLERGESMWLPEYTEAAESLALSRHDILTIASLIQKDCVYKNDYEQYSSVIHNRLAQTMKIESEGSVRYGMSEPPAVLTQEDYDNPHPYNSFVNYGLPPGPISNVGEDALRAAVFPATSPFLFAGKDPTGRMFFKKSKLEFDALMKRYYPERYAPQDQDQEEEEVVTGGF